MRSFVFPVLFVVVGTAFMFMAFSSISSPHDMVQSATDEDSVTLITLIHSRKLKESFDPSTKRKSHTDLNLEDYRPIDPVPSSKATIKPKPIAHGSPLMPYIPKPAPPTPPKHGGPPGGHY